MESREKEKMKNEYTKSSDKNSNTMQGFDKCTSEDFTKTKGKEEILKHKSANYINQCIYYLHFDDLATLQKLNKLNFYCLVM